MRVMEKLLAALDRLGEVIFGKEKEIRLAVACLLARGHLLIEDIPGVGKTTLAHALALVLGVPFRRIQFTSDLLPADVVGNSIFSTSQNAFIFHPGPLFTPLILVDEINRATPRTQSALLEAMEECQVSVDGTSHPLPDPFFVIATQNPQTQLGTFALPEAQLDRFLMRLSLGFPDRIHERAMLVGESRRALLKRITPVLTTVDLLQCQKEVDRVHTAGPFLDYLQDILDESRRRFRPGLSPRAGLALMAAARSWTYLRGADATVPEDLQAVAPAVISHRLGAYDDGEADADQRALGLLASVRVP